MSVLAKRKHSTHGPDVQHDNLAGAATVAAAAAASSSYGPPEIGRGVPPPSAKRRHTSGESSTAAAIGSREGAAAAARVGGWYGSPVRSASAVSVGSASSAAAAAAAAPSPRSLSFSPLSPSYSPWAASTLVAGAGAVASAVAHPAPASPSSRVPTMLPSVSRPNLLWNTLARQRGLLPPSMLADREISLRLSTLALSDSKSITNRHTHNINDLDVDSTESRYLLSAGGDGLVGLYDLASPINSRALAAKPLYQPPTGHEHTGAVVCVSWYPFDTGLFVSGGAEGKVGVWDTNSFTMAHSFSLGGVVHAARMSSCATTHALIATGSASQNVRLCDMNSGAFSHTLLGHSAEVLTVEWHPRNEFQLATGSSDKTVRVWDIRRAGALLTMDQYNQTDTRLNRKYIDVRDNHAKRDVAAHDGPVHCLRYTPDGSYLLSAGTDRKVRLWDSTSARNSLVNFAEASSAHRINRFALSQDGRHLFYPQGSALLQLDVHSGRLLQRHKAHFDRVMCVAANPATQEVYSAGADRQIVVWAPRDRGVLTAQQREAERAEEAERARLLAEQQSLSDRESQLKLLASMERRRIGGSAAAASSSSAAAPRKKVLKADEDAWSDSDEED